MSPNFFNILTMNPKIVRLRSKITATMKREFGERGKKRFEKFVMITTRDYLKFPGFQQLKEWALESETEEIAKSWVVVRMRLNRGAWVLRG